MDIEIVTLRTGEAIPKPVLLTTMIALSTLHDESFVAFLDVTIYAHFPTYEPLKPSALRAQALGLLVDTGYGVSMHDSIRSVIVAATEVNDEVGARIVSPMPAS